MPGPAPDSERSRPPLAALLVDAGIASEEQLRSAAAEGMQRGERLGEVLLRWGLIDERVLAGLLAEQWELPFDDGTGPVDEQALALIPQDEAVRLDARAIRFADGAPVVAIAAPNDERIASVRAILENARFVIVTRTTLANLLGGTVVTAPEASSPVTGAATDDDMRLLLTDVDAATASVAAIRVRAERLAMTYAEERVELEASRKKLELLTRARADDQATIESLRRELAEQREVAASIKARLGELTNSLDK